MNYNKFQKFTSSFLIFFLLFSITFRFPIGNIDVLADNRDYYDLVSIIVDSETYYEIDSELKRYSKDISSNLENTKVVILPVDKETSVYQIASMNEALYYQWYKAFSDVNYESSLVWTVLVWDIEIPEVYIWEDFSKTIFPYVDFDDKSYIYSSLTNRYESNTENTTGLIAEIWHWVISPNTWDFDDDIKKLKDFFDKNNDFYEWKGLYDADKWYMNGDLSDDLNQSYEPYVFYFDSVRENQSLNYSSYVWYNLYQENKEDLVYNRFTSDFANYLKEKFSWKDTDDILSMVSNIDDSIDVSQFSQDENMDLQDIQARHIIKNSIKSFVEIFSPWSIGDLRKDIYNAWRYNFWNNVNVDFSPYIVNVLDIVNDQIIKELNDDFEKQVDDLVKNWLSRKVAILNDYEKTKEHDSTFSSYTDRWNYVNYLYWKRWKDISYASQCGIYLWSNTNGWQLVEANRAYNIDKISTDIEVLKPYMSSSSFEDKFNDWSAFNWYWWWNTPLNLDKDLLEEWKYKINYSDKNWSIIPLLDIDWAVLSSWNSNTPLFCERTNLINTYENDWDDYYIPSIDDLYNRDDWSYNIDTNRSWRVIDLSKNFSENYKTISASSCDLSIINLNSTEVKKIDWWSNCENDYTYTYNYKSIPSYIIHKSPTSDEISSQVKSWVAKNLPIDKDRYIDYLSIDGSYEKINYPYLFRIDSGIKTLDDSKSKLDSYLDDYSNTVNDKIKKYKVSDLSWQDLEIYNLLKTWNYPSSNFDLKKYLKNKWSKNLNIEWETISISYYDMLIFAIYWNNLDNVSEKYSFIFDKYLSNQTMFDNGYMLPKNKKQYEISYLWSTWNSQEMYIWIDPENKWENPYSDIIWQNQWLSNDILNVSSWNSNYSSKDDNSCAPPEWVPIMEWFPAIQCWLNNMLPATIWLSSWTCWPSLLSPEEREYIESCNWDTNKNGINDCSENTLKTSTLDLSSDTQKYFYNKTAYLKSRVIWENWNVVKYLNTIKTKYYIEKVELVNSNNTEKIYDINDEYLDDKSNYSPYLYFIDADITLNAWESNYQIKFKDTDLNVYIKSEIIINNSDWVKTIDLKSNSLKLELRWESLFSSASKIYIEDNNIFSSSDDAVEVNSKPNIYLIDSNRIKLDEIKTDIYNHTNKNDKLVFELSNYSKSWNSYEISYPITVKLFEWWSSVSTNVLNSSDLSSFYDLYSISKSWEYKLQIIDANWLLVSNNFYVTAWEVSSIDLNLWSNYVDKWWIITTNYATLKDVYWNVANSNFYDIDLNIDWKWILFNDNKSEVLKLSTNEWYVVFRTISTDKKWDNQIKIDVLDNLWNIINSREKEIKVIDWLFIEKDSLTWDFKIDTESNKLQIKIIDSNWNIVYGFNTRWYFNIDSMYASQEKSYFNIENWVWVLVFDTNTIAWKDIPVSFQIEGLSNIYESNIDILPWKAMKLDLALSNGKLEANWTSYSILDVELKDIYNNLVFTENSINTNIEILEKYENIVSFDSASAKVNWWKASYKIYSTTTPWLAYFKVWTNPSLSNNTFTLSNESWDFVINWVWENAWKIETFYVWDESKISENNYNSLYTTLLGASYWDYEKENYLAGSILFDESSRWLAVTSLISNPYKVNNTFSVSKNSWLNILASSSDLSQDIEYNAWIENKNLYFNIFNKALNTYIWKVYYNLDDNIDLDVCESVESCINDSDKTSIVWKNINNNFSFFLDWKNLVLRDDFWKDYLVINEDEWFSINKPLNFEIVQSGNSYLSLNILEWKTVIWNINLSINDNIDTTITRSLDLFNQKIWLTNNNILIYLSSYAYGYYTVWSEENSKVVIYYNDPFGTNNSLSEFTKENLFWYENYLNKSWLWWKEWNKTLLSFSAWKTVWESVLDYQSFSVINLWDPVVSLKKQKKKFSDSNSLKQFDSTIWDLIINDQKIVTYKIFDYNNDNIDDILLIKEDGYLQLLEWSNTSQKFINKWNLAFAIDIWDLDLINVWDFTWDGFSDIFFVWQDGNPYLFNNVNKDFSRISLVSKFDLNARILRAKSFDMDNDSIDDLVVLDDSWYLNIFYGKNISSNPSFDKNTISNSFGIKLDEWVRSDGWLLYFDWLYQVDYSLDGTSKIEQNELYLNNIMNNSSWGAANYNLWDWDPDLDSLFWAIESSDTSNWKIDENLLNSFIFERVNYEKDSNYYSDVDLWDDLSSSDKSTTFIKSEYSEFSWLSFEKTYKDRNWFTVKSWDIIDVEIIIKNTSYSRINNIAYIEDINDIFVLEDNTIVNSLWLAKKNAPNSMDFMYDGFSLNSWETFTVNYSAKVKPFTHSYIQVWYFENWESWDDLYGDIMIQKDKSSCSWVNDIFRSVSTRTYSRWIKEPVCDDTELPDNLKNNSIDNNKNGIPDYIDELTSDPVSLTSYADEQLKDIYNDSDWDGIPDSEDSFNSQDGVLWDLNNLESELNEWLDSLQETINWLSCWFNNGWCIATPLNWSPLAPWNDPTFNWYPIWDGLKVEEWIPVFSALTWFPWPFWVPIPWVWPPFPGSFPAYSSPWAGWYLWTTNPANFFRLFVTPTLTWWVWVAACFGWPAAIAWYSFLPWLSPLVPGWNCIVTAKPFLWCSSDWSGGNPASVWTPTYGSSFWVINWTCEKDSAWNYVSSNVADNYLSYLSWGSYNNSLLSDSAWAVSDHSSTWNWPLYKIGSEGTDLSLTLNSSDWFDYSDVKEFTQTRIQSYPWFIMNWITAQLEEIATKLTDFPNLYIILPDFTSIFPSSWWEIEDSLSIDSNFWDTGSWVTTINSWIKEVYSTLSSLPLVNITQENLIVYLPSITQQQADKVAASRTLTVNQREQEIERFSNDITYGYTCSNYYDNEDDIEACEEKRNDFIKLTTDFKSTISSIRKNIEIIKSYGEIPKEVAKLINKKEDYLEQVLCNVEAIGWNFADWIDTNWDRFKTWVELFIIIKAVLKSWQLLVDVFVWYEQECKECKNERWDLLNFEFELISMIVPNIPIIKFPKWPDIILDLHNIRAWLEIVLPQIQVEPRTINLPDLPPLILPDGIDINISISIPEVPLLPEINIPELRDLPSLPSFELPNLPPAPMLPKIFSQLEWFLNILKLITKAMCILKSSPFVPEWRAWDHIAFLTERSGYLPTDFINVSLPQYSYSAVDAVEIKSYVNLDFGTDFIPEYFRTIIEPINNFTSDYTNAFGNIINIDALDYGDFWNDINVDIDLESTEPSIDRSFDWSYNYNSLLSLIVYAVSNKFRNWIKYIDENKSEEITNLEFKKNINSFLSSEIVTKDPKLDELRNVWKEVNNYTFSKEDKIIDDLYKNNIDKFQTVKSIITSEIEYNKNLKNKLETPFVLKLSDDSDRVNAYNKELKVYNEAFVSNVKDLYKYDNSLQKELNNMKDDLISKVDSALPEVNNKNLIAANNDSSNNWGSCNSSWNTSWDYSYNYEWIYILEDSKSYRLFDYLDELSWWEDTSILDYDNDGDEDMLYFVNGSLYLKENLKIKDNKVFLDENPIVVDMWDNKFIENDFISSVNSFRETTPSNNLINLSFLKTQNIDNYRLSFYSIVDKFLNEKNPIYTPLFKKKYIYDMISWIDINNLNSENELYNEYKNLVQIKNFWNINWVKIESLKFKNIKEDIDNWNIINLTSWRKIYSWDTASTVKYYRGDNGEVEFFIIPKNRYIELKTNIIVVSIIWDTYITNGEIYVYEWAEIRNYLWFPFFEGSKIYYDWNDNLVQDNSYIELEYYDESELSLDFEYDRYWELYDLWESKNIYNVSISKNNDFYYSKMNSFSENILSTINWQVLLSPQVQADNVNPELYLDKLLLPVYQEKDYELANFIFDDSWVNGIQNIFIDFDLELDSDLDWNTKNDDDSSEMENINFIKWNDSLILRLWKFDSLFKKNIWITIVDSNNNITYKDINLEVYSPVPSISSYEWENIRWDINESLTDEPVNIYRYRAWWLTQLKNSQNNFVSNTNSWDFSFKVDDSNSWLDIFKDEIKIASIDEFTWKITILNSWYKVEVIKSNDGFNDMVYPKLVVTDINNNEVYYQTIKTTGSNVSVVNDFDDADESWVYIMFIDKINYNYYILPDNISYNPWLLSIYRNSNLEKEALFSIFPDGRIFSANDYYELVYDNYEDNVIIKLYDRHFNREVARVMYNVNSEFLIK